MNRLKKELEQLKRENKRLRKLLNQRDGAVTDPFEDEESEEVVEAKKPRATRKKGEKCPKCKEPAEEKEFGPFTYLWCTDPKCNHRRKVK